jgi:hypothetical protein
MSGTEMYERHINERTSIKKNLEAKPRRIIYSQYMRERESLT